MSIKFSLLLFTVFSIVSSNAQGIQFEKVQNWKDVIAKAKAENKFIFVDCYTTWCGPCKLMDTQIYPLNFVGEYYNKNFISIKLQFDKTAKDDSLTRKWYEYAKKFQTTYAINVYPTFLFFDANGVPVHKVVGSQSVNNFIQIGKDAQVPERQYYSIIKNYVPGKLDTAELKGLASLFQYDNKMLAGIILKDYFNRIPRRKWSNVGNVSFLIEMAAIKEAEVIAFDILSKQKLSSKDKVSLFSAFQNDTLIQKLAYKELRALSKKKQAQTENLQLLTIFKNKNSFKGIAEKYINSLSNKEALYEDNINLMKSFMKSSRDRSFSLFLDNSRQIDLVMKMPYYAEFALAKIVITEDVSPEIKKAANNNKEPDWNAISRAIEAKYNKGLADRCIINAKIGYHQKIKNWNEFVNDIIEHVEMYVPVKPESALELNKFAFLVFENTSDSNDLKKANEWMDVALKSDNTGEFYGLYMGTKAEIIYKLGFKNEAIQLMAQAIAVDKVNNPWTNDSSWYYELEAMKRGEKIWPEKVDGK